MKLKFTCQIIGDGLTPETAFRPDLSGVVHPITGASPVGYSAPIQSDNDGTPLHDTVEIIAEFAD